MTPAPQSSCTSGEQEYRINESDLIKLQRYRPTPDDMRHLRSRPIAAVTPLLDKQSTNDFLTALESVNCDERCKYFHFPICDDKAVCQTSHDIVADHDAAIHREAYEQGAREERERVLEVISDGKSALYEIKPDGNWDYILQAKMDVLCWIEESLRSSK